MNIKLFCWTWAVYINQTWQSFRLMQFRFVYSKLKLKPTQNHFVYSQLDGRYFIILLNYPYLFSKKILSNNIIIYNQLSFQIIYSIYFIFLIILYLFQKNYRQLSFSTKIYYFFLFFFLLKSLIFQKKSGKSIFINTFNYEQLHFQLKHVTFSIF